MSDLTNSIPPDAQNFIERIKECTSPEKIKASTPSGVQELLITPGSKVIWDGVIYPDNIQWEGEKPDKPYYLVMTQTPIEKRSNRCTWWWFSMDTTITVEVESSQIVAQLPPTESQQRGDSFVQKSLPHR